MSIMAESRSSAGDVERHMSIMAESRSSLVAQPVSLPTSLPSVSEAFDKLLHVARQDHGDENEKAPWRALMVERVYYDLATSVLPPFAERMADSVGKMDATALFSRAGTKTILWELRGQCEPELHVRGKLTDDAGAGTGFVPGYNGELKTAGDVRALDQAVYYAFMDMTRIFFPARTNAQGATIACPRRYFDRPPVAYALLAYPHVGYFVAIEMIGRLFVSPVSAPFFVGSREHADAARALPVVKYAAPVEVPDVETGTSWQNLGLPGRAPHVLWTVRGDTFLKIVRCTARTGPAFASMYRVYSHLSAILSEAGKPASLPASVQLLYGAHEVLLKMTAVHGKHCSNDKDVVTPGRVLACVADAIAWLARHRIVYVDLRGPNVMIPDDAARTPACLVDFDDCMFVDGPVLSLDDYRAHLAIFCAHVQGDPTEALLVKTDFFAAQFLEHTYPAVEAALESAFATYADGAAL